MPSIDHSLVSEIRERFCTSHTLNNTIKKAKSDLRILFNAQSGEFFMGESGTELLFRLIRNAVTASPPGGSIV